MLRGTFHIHTYIAYMYVLTKYIVSDNFSIHIIDDKQYACTHVYTYVTGPVKTGDICINYNRCLENETFLGHCL